MTGVVERQVSDTPARPDRFIFSWSSFIGALFAGLVFLQLAQPLKDNSLFTHIATGRLILATGSVPTSDVYTYTADGAPWVVQSWAVSVLYAGLEQVFGTGAIRVFSGLTGAGVFVALWVAARPLNLVIRSLAVGILAVSSVLYLTPRPTLFGVAFLVLAVTAARGLIPVVTLVPVGILWVNAHGSWPMGLAVIGVLLVGVALDRGDWRKPLTAALALSGGLLVGAVGPLGVNGLTFPLSMSSRQDVLGYIVEWRRPDIFSIPTMFLWSLIVLAVVAWWRNRTWQSALLITFSVVLGLSANRNIPVASFLLLFPIVDGMRGVGKNIGRGGSRVASAATAVLVAGCVIASVVGPANWNYSAYPVAATDQLEAWGWMQNPDVRVAGQMSAGNYWSLRYGPNHKILYDDRFDMYDKELIERLVAIDSKDRSPDERRVALESFNPDVVVWNADTRHLPDGLRGVPGWREILTYDDGWVVFCRESSSSVPCSSL